jgi:putative oxidoreductase
MNLPATTMPSAKQINAAFLILRTASALAFLYHGSSILFGAFAGPGPDRFAASHNWPMVIGYLVGLGQCAGALAILTGVFTRLGAASIAVVMLGAIFLVHLPHGFDVNNGGMEYALTQLLLAIAFVISGPGAYSLGSLLPTRLQRL